MKKTKLILLRHGQSVWNKENLFTGWVDIPLSEQGIRESVEAGKVIADLPIDLVFTSTLVRAHMTTALALLQHKSGRVPVFQHPGQPWSALHGQTDQTVPVFMSDALNERMYGELQGLNKAETAKKFGDNQVHLWRRSFDVAPPGGESLQMTAQRTLPYFRETILPQIKQGKHVLISAHGNSLRSIVMHLEKLSPQEVVALEIATGQPIVYTCENGHDFVRCP